MKAINLFAVVLVFTVNAFAADALTERLQRGLFEEEANRNLDAAIKEYQSVVTSADEQRKVVATALFRLGECYRKLGRTNDATAFYQRIVRDFSEQEQLAKLAADFLKPASAPVPAGNQSELVRELQRRAAVLKVESMTALMEHDRLTTLTPAQLAHSSAATNSPALAQLEPQLLVTEQKLTLLKEQFGDQHPEVKAMTALQKTIRQQYDEALKGIVTAAQQRADSLAGQLRVVNEELTKAGAGTPEPPRAATETTSLTQAEAEELARVKTLARNSPDLLQSPSGPWGGPLPTAAVAGHYSVVEFLLSLGLSPDGVERGRPPLLIAAGAGHLRIVQLLLDKGADVNAADPTQETALMYAVFNGRRTVVELLLERGADVNRANNDGITALHKVAFKGYSGLAELLLKRGCKPDALSKNQKILQYDGTGWPNFTYNGTTPLHLAVERQHTALVEVLLKQGASAKVTNYSQITPLHLASASDNTNIAALLLAQGANPNTEDSQGYTPFGRAIENGQPAIVALMLTKGAQVNKPLSVRLEPSSARILGRQFNLVYPLNMAVSRNNGTLGMLLTAKPDLEVTNSSDMTPLLEAVIQGNTEMVESLLEAGADPNHKTEKWGAPVLQAVSRSSPPTVQALLKHGANPNVYSSSGETPLSLAQDISRNTAPEGPRGAQIAQALREHGASENLRRLFAIDYTRPSWTTPGPKIFSRGTNDYNRHTLFEFLAAVFSENRRSAFPDLAHVTIERLEGTNAKPKQIALNIESLLLATNCSNNLWMEWGDRVSFPELDHPLNAGWTGFSNHTRDLLSQCLERSVQIIVKQETNTVRLVQNMDTFPVVADAGDDANPVLVFTDATFNTVGAVANPAPSPPAKVLATFRLKEVVYGANVLRASSDPTRVRVSRFDPVTHKPETWVIDLTKVATSTEWGNNLERQGKLWNLHDLWLRDGDLIEVPEKP